MLVTPILSATLWGILGLESLTQTPLTIRRSFYLFTQCHLGCFTPSKWWKNSGFKEKGRQCTIFQHPSLFRRVGSFFSTCFEIRLFSNFVHRNTVMFQHVFSTLHICGAEKKPMACWERVEGVIFQHISVSGSKGQLDSQLPVHLGEHPAVMRHILESRNRMYKMQRTSTEICQRHL